MLMELPSTRNAEAPHHGLTLSAMVLGGAIGAVRSKSGHMGESVVKGAAVGVLAVYGLVALFGATVIGGLLYTRLKYGPSASHEFVQKLSTIKPGN